MRDFDIRNGSPSNADRVHEISPELRNILLIGFKQFRVLGNDSFVSIGWIKGPTIQPAHVEGSFGSIEITADRLLGVGFFSVISGILPMFPNSGEGFELKGSHLGIRRVGAV